MQDPYSVLGLSRDAGEADIKKAFRRLAKTYHPDKNPNDAKAKDRFNEISAAYDFLSDKNRRAAYDRGEIGPDGQPRFRGFEGMRGGGKRSGGFEGFSWGSSEGFSRGANAGAGSFNAEDIMADVLRSFGGARGGGQTKGARANQRAATKGEDASTEVSIPFLQWARGAKVRVKLPTGRELEVAIPAGIAEGKTVRLKGQGHPSPMGGANGDALITVRIIPHPQFRVEGNSVRVEVPVTLYEAVLGAKVRVPTLDGAADLTVPPRTTGARTMRLRGKGLTTAEGTGDLLVSLRIVLPDRHDAELDVLARRMRDGAPYDPRNSDA